MKTKFLIFAGLVCAVITTPYSVVAVTGVSLSNHPPGSPPTPSTASPAPMPSQPKRSNAPPIPPSTIPSRSSASPKSQDKNAAPSQNASSMASKSSDNRMKKNQAPPQLPLSSDPAQNSRWQQEQKEWGKAQQTGKDKGLSFIPSASPKKK